MSVYVIITKLCYFSHNYNRSGLMSTQQIGIIGMAVMGRNLALNIESHGYKVSIFNRSRNKTDEFVAGNLGKNLVPCYTIKNLVFSLEKPRNILLMVKAGDSIDQTIALLKPYLEYGDTLIDGGNSFYKDTVRRNYELLAEGFNFIGTGISGGEEGALTGPSLMPGGQKHAYELIAPLFKKIAARAEGKACVAYIGPDGSGHYVKMVHNGIEYADMQLIAEAYTLLKRALGMSYEELSDTFREWNKGELSSYLIDITKDILAKKDTYGNYIVDIILDKAENKGTGKWISQSSLELEEPLSIVTESVFARYISSLKNQRIAASKVLDGPKIKPFSGNKDKFIENVRRALYLGKIVSYAQGFSQLRAASYTNNWHLNYGEIAEIFRAGCIIRAQFLQKITDAYAQDNSISNLMLTPYFKQVANTYQYALRDIAGYAIQHGIPTPALLSAISYYDSYRSALLPANLIQAQRDYFGSHTYKRIDKDGIFHTKWLD